MCLNKIKMPSTIFNKCCFCLDLRVGCFIIGYLELALTVIAMVATIIKMAAAGALIAAAAKMRADSDSEMTSVESGSDAISGSRTMVMTGFLLFFILLTMAFVITFIVGLHQKKSAHIMAYFVYANVALVIELIIFAIACITQLGSTLFFIGYLIAILIHVYFLMVVRDYYVIMNFASYPAINNT